MIDEFFNERFVSLSFFLVAAGTAFTEASQLQLNQLQNKHEAAQHYVDAATCFKKSDNEGNMELRLYWIKSYCYQGLKSPVATRHLRP